DVAVLLIDIEAVVVLDKRVPALDYALRLSDLHARRCVVEPIEDASGPQIVVLKDELIGFEIHSDGSVSGVGMRERPEIQSARDLILRFQWGSPLLCGHQERSTR